MVEPPLWKIWSSNWVHLPKFRVKIPKIFELPPPSHIIVAAVAIVGKNRLDKNALSKLLYPQGTVPDGPSKYLKHFKATCTMTMSIDTWYKVGPLPVINGVITPVNGLINRFNWAYNLLVTGSGAHQTNLFRSKVPISTKLQTSGSGTPWVKHVSREKTKKIRTFHWILVGE